MDPWSTFLPHLLPSSPLRSHQCGICKVENAGIPDPGFTGLSGTSSPCDILPPNPGHTQAPRRQKNHFSLCHSGKNWKCSAGLSWVRCLSWRCSTGTAPVPALGGHGVFPLPWMPQCPCQGSSGCHRQGTDGAQCLAVLCALPCSCSCNSQAFGSGRRTRLSLGAVIQGLAKVPCQGQT